MGRDTFDAVLASVPLNGTAGAITSRSKDNWEPKRKAPESLQHWDAPPPMRAITKAERCNPQFVDVTGKRMGRLTVVGILHEPDAKPDRKARWVVRCACGDYEVRTAKSIKKAAPENRCFNCETLGIIQRRYSALGGRPIEDFTK